MIKSKIMSDFGLEAGPLEAVFGGFLAFATTTDSLLLGQFHMCQHLYHRVACEVQNKTNLDPAHLANL